MTRVCRPVATLAALGLVASCSAPPETPPPAPSPVSNPALGLRLSQLPEGLTVTVADGPRWAFAAPIGETAGTATIEWAEARSAAVNLVEEAKRYGDSAAATEGGKFFGGNELVTPYGSAYTVRVLADRGLVEERVVFLLHPDGSQRLLRLVVRYPPGDGDTARARLMQALELVGALEPLAAE